MAYNYKPQAATPRKKVNVKIRDEEDCDRCIISNYYIPITLEELRDYYMARTKMYLRSPDDKRAMDREYMLFPRTLTTGSAFNGKDPYGDYGYSRVSLQEVLNQATTYEGFFSGHRYIYSAPIGFSGSYSGWSASVDGNTAYSGSAPSYQAIFGEKENE